MNDFEYADIGPAPSYRLLTDDVNGKQYFMAVMRSCPHKTVISQYGKNGIAYVSNETCAKCRYWKIGRNKRKNCMIIERNNNENQ